MTFVDIVSFLVVCGPLRSSLDLDCFDGGTRLRRVWGQLGRRGAYQSSHKSTDCAENCCDGELISAKAWDLLGRCAQYDMGRCDEDRIDGRK